MGMSVGVVASAMRGMHPGYWPECEGWWDISDSATVTADVNGIQQVTDKTGNGYTMLSRIGTGLELISPAQNGKDAMEQDHTANEYAWTGADFTAVEYYGAAAVACMYADATFANFDSCFTPDFGETSSFGGVSGGSTFAFNPGGSQHYKNGVATTAGPMSGAWSVCIFNDPGAGANNRTATKFVLGDDRTQGGREWKGRIGEAMVFNPGTGLTQAQRTAITRYMGARWGISVTLPSA